MAHPVQEQFQGLFIRSLLCQQRGQVDSGLGQAGERLSLQVNPDGLQLDAPGFGQSAYGQGHLALPAIRGARSNRPTPAIANPPVPAGKTSFGGHTAGVGAGFPCPRFSSVLHLNLQGRDCSCLLNFVLPC